MFAELYLRVYTKCFGGVLEREPVPNSDKEDKSFWKWIWEWLTFPIRLTALIPHLIAALATLWILAKQRSPELTFEGWR
ncbi:MAG: hypothetical protein WC343_03240 [Bacilli bacterium]|jgi:hypothetical protein